MAASQTVSSAETKPLPKAADDEIEKKINEDDEEDDLYDDEDDDNEGDEMGGDVIMMDQEIQLPRGKSKILTL